MPLPKPPWTPAKMLRLFAALCAVPLAALGYLGWSLAYRYARWDTCAAPRVRASGS